MAQQQRGTESPTDEETDVLFDPCHMELRKDQACTELLLVSGDRSCGHSTGHFLVKAARKVFPGCLCPSSSPIFLTLREMEPVFSPLTKGVEGHGGALMTIWT